MKKRFVLAFVILSILLLISYYKFGLFTPYNYFTAKYDLMKGNVRVLYYGMALPNDDLKKVIAKERGFKYERAAGCNVTYELENGVEAYNSVVNDYLSNKLGKDWEKEFDEQTELDYSNRNKKRFPAIPYKYGKIYSIENKKNTYDSIDEKLLPKVAYMGGFSFIDSSGNLLHKNIVSRYLTAREISIIDSSFKLPVRKLQPDYACFPVYRDAVIYYDSLDKPVAYLNICFGCRAIIFKPESDIFVDEYGFNGLYKLFK